MSTDDRVRPSAGPLPHALSVLGFGLLLWGSIWGLFFAPRETFMGDVQRIMYIHVPTAWNAMLALTFAFGCALLSVWQGGWRWDARLEGALEVGVLLSTLLCLRSARSSQPAASRRSRSDSLNPPHTPYGSRTDRACAAHSARTGHPPQTALACASRRLRDEPHRDDRRSQRRHVLLPARHAGRLQQLPIHRREFGHGSVVACQEEGS